jgi:hypothetical protein
MRRSSVDVEPRLFHLLHHSPSIYWEWARGDLRLVHPTWEQCCKDQPFR